MSQQKKRSIITKRKRKLNSNGSRTKTRPGTGYITECPFCPWKYNEVRHQNEPVRLSCSGVTEIVQCSNGHEWRT